MPQTKKGKKIMSAMTKQYGKEKAKNVYFGSIVKGKITGAEGKGGTGKLAKAKATYAKKHKPTRSQVAKSVKKTMGY